MVVGVLELEEEDQVVKVGDVLLCFRLCLLAVVLAALGEEEEALFWAKLELW